MFPISERFRRALDYAATVHAGQARKGTQIPYLSHLLSVSASVMEYGGNEDEAIAALLHDVIEDTDVTEEMLQKQFGHNVATIVRQCSDSTERPKPAWRDRKEEYLLSMKTKCDSARFVSACDKLHNARSILRDFVRMGDAVFDRFDGGKEGTLWYYRSLADGYALYGPRRVAEDLERVVSELEKQAASGRDRSINYRSC